MSTRQVGTRVKRLEDPALLAGKGRFTDDIPLPGALNACFVRSPHGHAKIRSIDVSAALAAPGVHAVLTAKDLPARLATDRIPMLMPNPTLTGRTQHCLALDEVNYAGQGVALVVAESRYAAEDAISLVEVDYEVLPAVSDCREAVKDGAPLVHSDLPNNVASRYVQDYGDIAAAFANAAHVVTEDFAIHRGGGMSMETRAVAAKYEADTDLLTVWSATQAPHLNRRTLADLFERDLESIRMIAPDVGGGFGPKVPFYAEEAVIPAAAMIVGRPVKWFEDRREHFMCATQERDQYWSMAMALDADGKVLGLKGTMLHDTGAFVPWGIIMPYIASTTVPGPYVLPAYHLDVTIAWTNSVATSPVRGAGRPQAVFVMERMMDRAATALKLDRGEIRRRNFIQPEQMPYKVGLIFRDGKPLVYDGGDFPIGQRKAIANSDYDGFAGRQAKALKEGRYIGLGLANYVEGTGLGPFEGVTVRVLPNGRVAVATGATAQGQGTRTALSQIVAEKLGVRVDDIVMTLADTAAFPQGMGAFASRQAINAGNSAMMAGDAVRKKAIELAAKTLGVEESDIDLDDGFATAQTGNKPRLSLGDLARLSQGMPGFSMAPGQTPGLENTAYFTPAQASYCSGTHIVEVEVDVMTGGVSFLNYEVSHDCGTVINPLIVDGQVQGGVAHGIGNALFEHMIYDPNGQPLTITFADYLLPMATDVPTARIEHIDNPNPLNPLGVKGAGEGGTIPAPAAIVAAIEDALSSFGVTFAEIPLTPEKIVNALRAKGVYDTLFAQ